MANTEILQHNIMYWLSDENEHDYKIDESNEEHIKECIADGCNQGELCQTIQGDKGNDITEARGWWRIVK